MEKLSILVLHSLGDPKFIQSFLNHHVFALQRNFPAHDYLYHDTSLPLPEYIEPNDFDAIVLDVTFLTARWAGPEFFKSIKSQYEFVKDSSAVKIAFPQDEYDCNILLDNWMCEWNVDIVFSVIASHWDVLYPNYHKKGNIRLGYTSYIDESLIDRPIKPFNMRSIDIGYRAKKLPPYFGRLGQTKWTIGLEVKQRGLLDKLNIDIEIGDQGTLYGEAWLNFINDSKFTLGANSGSSLLDPVGDIQRNIKLHLSDNPEVSFEELEAIFFPNQDGIFEFTAISPRVLEAALFNSGQILVDGGYSGVVRPWDHFIPIKKDASNFDEVLDAMADKLAVEKMIKNCRDAILSVEQLRYKNHSSIILNLIMDLASKKRLLSNRERVRKSISKYRLEMQPKFKLHWRIKKLRAEGANFLAPYPFFLNMAKSAIRLFR